MFKYLLIGALSFAALSAQADETSTAPIPQHYEYGMKLDIAKVVSQSEGVEVNGIIPMQMTYQDSRGERHTLQYDVLSARVDG
jgi:Protein of unknown function (DUF2790)